MGPLFRIPSAVLSVTLGLAVAGSAPAELHEFQVVAMGTRFTIRTEAASRDQAELAARAAFERVRQLDKTCSDYDPESELMRFCRAPAKSKVMLSPDLYSILQIAQDLAHETNGAFDVTIGPLKRLWRLSRRDARLPDAEKLAAAKAKTGHRKLILYPDGAASLAISGMRLDLGGIAKGYAADAALEVLTKAGFAKSLVAASGDIAVGEPFHSFQVRTSKGDDQMRIGWWVSLSGPTPLFNLADCGVSTSGDTTQFVEISGRRYSHILDPKTGVGLTYRRCVNVIASDAVTADSLATAISVAGIWPSLLDERPDTFIRIVEQDAGGGFTETRLGGRKEIRGRFNLNPDYQFH